MNKKIETIAMYLPQFHAIPENDEWWGEGYTEWTAVQNADKLFEGHNQPREPLNDNYYNLLDKSTMEQQAEMARKYGLDGFCFYHYYFKDGKKVLEKPAENLLGWKEVDMPFCFCWANESWARTWSKISDKLIWADKFEKKDDVKQMNGILLEQKYEREQAWQQHFEYLLPFFKDERYIKVGDAPIFLIHQPGAIACLPEMIYYWKTKAKENGISNIYVIGLNTTKRLNGLDAVLINGPGMYVDQNARGRNIEFCSKNGTKIFRYQDAWENAVEAAPVSGCRTYFGTFVDYDDTPRRGKNGWCLEGTSTELFEKYLYLLMKKNQMAGNEFVFINAFNEWGEGMYLEPDKRNGYKYLEILQEVKEKVNGEQTQIMKNDIVQADFEENELQCKIKKLGSYFSLMDKWMVLREQNRRLADYLKKYHFNEVAVYGMGVLGRHLVSELLDDGVKIKYAIDKNEKITYPGIKICRLDSGLEEVDAIIVTAIYEYKFGDIWNDIRACKLSCPILSLLEMIEEI